MVIPVILAGGVSERMGVPKPYIRVGKKTFLEIIAERLRKAGINSPGFVVFNEKHKSLIEKIELPDFSLIPNARQELGQLYSLQLALSRVPENCSGVIMCLADHPFVKAKTYRLLLETHRAFPGKILIPTLEGRRGHPPLFPRSFFRPILELPLDRAGGVHNIIATYPDAIREILSNDAGVVTDLDTPADLHRAHLNVDNNL